MLRVVAHASAGAAKQYYTEGLRREDYYSEGQEIVGKWYGEAAKRLGLSGDVTREAFAALVENRHPVTGERLTPRTKSNRRVGYDFNFHCPKSLSVVYGMTQDREVLRVFREAVAETMQEVEQWAETRIRKGGAKANRATGNLAWAEFIHFTARPVGGVPDPHLHAHCFTFNATYDGVEERWKAAEFGAIKQEAHYAEAAFHARLTAKLVDLGFGIERKKSGWEVAGIPKSVIEKFSQRRTQIERRAAELGIVDAKSKDELGALTREGKRHGLTFPDLMAAWGSRLNDVEKAQIAKACFDKVPSKSPPVTAAEAMDYSIAKLFERQSMVERGHILAAALRFGAGTLSPDAIRAEFERRGFLGQKMGDRHLCTLEDILAEEVALVAFVRSGRNTAPRLCGKDPAISRKLSVEQQAAVKHILTSRDQVIALRGVAGAGKTTSMSEACKRLEAEGHKVFAFAPSASASRGTLRDSGFANADTVAQLLVNPKLQQQVRGNVVWVDEAGLLGIRDMWQLMKTLGPSTRIILTGDAAQHTPVPRCDAFRTLLKFAGLRVAEIKEVRRQQVADYREAIGALSKGDVLGGFRRLEALNAFVEIADDGERYRELARDYMTLAKRGKPPLVVSPTHAEGALVTAAIREARREAGQIGTERQLVRYQNLRWEEVERSVPKNYHAGMTVQFNQNCKGIKRGEVFRVAGVEDGRVALQNFAGKKALLPLSQAKRFQVYEERDINLAKGDRIRITLNGKSENGKRLNSGDSFTIKTLGKNGQITLSNGAVLAPSFKHFTHRYCETSHVSQSKTSRDVLVAQSGNFLVASSREQFYVSCSRGKEIIRIYTDNRDLLRKAVGATSTRLSGLELAGVTHKELSTFMAELGAKEWRKTVASRRGHDGTKGFLKHLTEQRKSEQRKPGEITNWEGYVKMRKAIAGPDGKSRSKGYNSQPQKGLQKQRGKTLPKTSHLSDGTVEKMEKKAAAKKEAAKEPAKKRGIKPQTRKERLTKAYQDSGKHLKNVASRTKMPVKKESRPVKMGNTKVTRPSRGNAERAAAHAERAKMDETRKQKQAKAKSKEQVKQQVKQPPPPGPKRR